MFETKIERIIFEKRYIESMEKARDLALSYANGEIDLHKEFSYILSDAERAIEQFAKYAEDLTDNRRVFDNLYDDDYYYDYECCDDFIDKFIKTGAFVQKMRQDALNRYHEYILDHKPDKQIKKYEKLKVEAYARHERLKCEIIRLSLPERMELKHTKKSPFARINSSPSFIMGHCGNLFAEGMAEGLKQ